MRLFIYVEDATKNLRFNIIFADHNPMGAYDYFISDDSFGTSISFMLQHGDAMHLCKAREEELIFNLP